MRHTARRKITSQFSPFGSGIVVCSEGEPSVTSDEALFQRFLIISGSTVTVRLTAQRVGVRSGRAEWGVLFHFQDMNS